MKKLMVIGLFVFGMILPNIDAKAVSIGGVDVDVVTSGDGLYADENIPGKYVYRGSNPDNYIEFNNELWRIISKEADGTYKIIRNDSLGGIAFDDGNANPTNDWSAPTSLNIHLNSNYYDSLSDDAKSLIVSHDYGVGLVERNNNLAEQIADENSKIWNGKIGLLTVSDLLNANSNMKECGTLILRNGSKCKNSEWLIKLAGYEWSWTLSSSSEIGDDLFNRVWVFGRDSIITVGADDMYSIGRDVFPVVYISSDIQFSGNGMKSSRFSLKYNGSGNEDNVQDSSQDSSEENSNIDEPSQIVNVPSTSLYGSIIIIVLGIVCIIVSVFVMRKVTYKK